MTTAMTKTSSHKIDPKKLHATADLNFEKARAIIRSQVAYLGAGIDSLAIVYVAGFGDQFTCDEKHRVFVDPEYAATVPPGQLAFDLLHELVGHLLPGHFARAEALKVVKELRKMWNYAGDEAGNGACLEIAAQSGGRILPMGSPVDMTTLAKFKKETTLVTAERFGHPDGLTVEEYFNLLLQMSPPPPPRGGKGKAKSDDGDSGDSGDGDSGDGEPGDGEPGDGQTPVNAPPGMKKPSCGGCSGDDESTKDVADKAAAQGQAVPPGRNSVEAESIRQQIAQAIEQEAETGRGNMPAGLVRWAKLTRQKPKVDWRRHIRALAVVGIGKAKGAADYTFAKVRRSGQFLVPTLFAPTPRIGFGIDTSGSMGDGDIGRCISEARGIFNLLQSAGDVEVWISSCDTHATPPVKFKRWDEKKVADLLKGGGGTDMAAAIRVFDKVQPQVLVISTDGDTGWPTEKPSWAKRVIVCLTRKTSCPTPEWATVVHAYD